jgi:hypothetical protein
MEVAAKRARVEQQHRDEYWSDALQTTLIRAIDRRPDVASEVVRLLVGGAFEAGHAVIDDVFNVLARAGALRAPKWAGLPSCLLVLIFDHLAVKDIWERSERVCKSWRAASVGGGGGWTVLTSYDIDDLPSCWPLSLGRRLYRLNTVVVTQDIGSTILHLCRSAALLSLRRLELSEGAMMLSDLNPCSGLTRLTGVCLTIRTVVRKDPHTTATAYALPFASSVVSLELSSWCSFAWKWQHIYALQSLTVVGDSLPTALAIVRTTADATRWPSLSTLQFRPSMSGHNEHPFLPGMSALGPFQNYDPL